MDVQGDPATVIVASSSDLASRTLAQALIDSEGFEATGVALLGKPVYQRGSLLLAFIEGLIVRPPDLDEYFNPLAYIFLSRHSAESGIASLTVHTTGNFSAEARFGGTGRELGRVDPALQKNYLMALAKRSEQVGAYQVTMEATHHGPTSLNKPVLFVELGSSEKYWGDKKAAAVVGGALVESLTKKEIWPRAAFGFGGTHYPEKFTRMSIDEDVAFSYLVPKYALGNMDDQMLGQMLQKTSGPVRQAILDWKGMGQYKERIVDLMSTFGLEALRV